MEKVQIWESKGSALQEENPLEKNFEEIERGVSISFEEEKQKGHRKSERFEGQFDSGRNSIHDCTGKSIQDQENFLDPSESNPLDLLHHLKEAEDLEKKNDIKSTKKSAFMRKSMYAGLQKVWRRDTIQFEEKLTQEEREIEYLEEIDKLIGPQDKANMLFFRNMNIVKRVKFYQDKYPFLTFRKGLLYLMKFISLLSERIIASSAFESVSLLVIVANSVTLALQSPMEPQDSTLDTLEFIFLILYTIEMFLKIFAKGFLLNKGAYLRDTWNILDFIIVTTAYIPLFFDSSAVNLSGLRSLRVLRPLKTITRLKKLRILLLALFSALPLLMDVVTILLFFFFIFAISGVQLYAGYLKNRCVNETTGKSTDTLCGNYDCVQGYFCAKLFDNPNWGVTSYDNIFSAFLMTFQTVTLEGWTQIMESIRITFNDLTIVYYIFLVFVGSFFLLNITLAVIKAKFSESQSDLGMLKLAEKDKKVEIIPKKEYLMYVAQWSELQFRKNMFYMIVSNPRKTLKERPESFVGRLADLFRQCLRRKKVAQESSFPGKNSKTREISIDEHLALQQLTESKSPKALGKELRHSQTNELSSNWVGSSPKSKRRSVMQEPLSLVRPKRESMTLPSTSASIHDKNAIIQQLKAKKGLAPINERKGTKRDSGVQAINDWIKASALKKKFDLFLNSDSYFSSGNTLHAGSDMKKLSYFSIASIKTSFRGEMKESVNERDQFTFEDDESDKFIKSLNEDRGELLRRPSDKQLAPRFKVPEKLKAQKVSDSSDNLKFSDLRVRKIKFKDESKEIESIPVIDLTNQTGDESKPPRRQSILKKSSFQKNQSAGPLTFPVEGPLSKISSFSISSDEGSPKIYPFPEKANFGKADTHDRSWEASQDSDFSPFYKIQEDKANKKRQSKLALARIEDRFQLNHRDQEGSKVKIVIDGFGESKTTTTPMKNDYDNWSPGTYGSPEEKMPISNGRVSEESFSKQHNESFTETEGRFPSVYPSNGLPNGLKKADTRRQSKLNKRRESKLKELNMRKNSLMVRKNSLIRKLSLTDNNQRQNKVGNTYQKKLSMNNEDAMILREKEKCELEQEEKRLKEIFETVDQKFKEIFVDHQQDPLQNSAENVLPSKASKLEEKRKQETDRLHKEMKMKMHYSLKKINILARKNTRKNYRFSLRMSSRLSKSLFQSEAKTFTRQTSHNFKKHDSELKKSDTNVSAMETPFKSMTSIMLQHKESRLVEPVSAGLKKNNSIMISSKKHAPQKQTSLTEQVGGSSTSINNNNVPKPANNKRATMRNTAKANLRKIDPQEVLKKENFEVITSRILEELLTKEVIIESENKEITNFTTEIDYQNIKKADLEIMKIKSKNWSGDEVLSLNRKEIEHNNKIFQSLNKYNINIWAPGWRGISQAVSNYFRNVVEEKMFENFIILVVVFNTCLLATDGLFKDQETLDNIQLINMVFTIVFASEMLFKLIAYGFRGYVRDKLNLFDGAIVIISLVEILFLEGGSKAISAFRMVRIFRTFRVLRVTKLLRSLAFMKVIIAVVSHSIQSFSYIAALLMLFIYIYTLMGIQLYGGTFNFDDTDVRQNFDTFNNAFLAVFQVLTLENWQNVLFLCFRTTTGPIISVLYLFSWIFIGNYVFLNLFLAILLDGFTSESEDTDEKDGGDENEEQALPASLPNNSAQIPPDPEPKPALHEKENEDDESSDDSRVDNDFAQNLKKEHKRLEEEANLFNGIECESAIYFLTKDMKFRRFLLKLSQHHIFENIILFLIVTSSMKLAFDTYVDKDTTDENELNVIWISDWVDVSFNVLFAVESLVKSLSYGFIMEKGSYLREPWNVMDFFIVCSSLLDMSLDAINIPIIKIFRLLRILRPLRFITHNINLKIVVVSLMNSVSAIINVLIVVLLVWLMFAILGMSFLQDKMGYCDFPKYKDRYNVSQDRCRNELKMEWKTYDTNFDNIFRAMVTLFIISSLEGWPDMMALAMDSDDHTVGPSEGANEYIAYYYVAFILIGSFFFLNLFTGAIFFHFNKAQKNEKSKSSKLAFFLTEDQMRWIQMQEAIIHAKPEYEKTRKPQDKKRLFFYEIVNSNKFEAFIMVCIVLNILTMAMTYEGSSQFFDDTLENVNYFFTSVFIMEATIKIIAYTFSNYWYNPWNKFDFFVVSASIFDIVMNAVGKGLMSFIRFGPQLARIFRVLRITRLFKLIKSFQGLQKLIQTIILTLPSLINVGALMFLIFFIYSILGNFMFKNVKGGVVTNDLNNFSNFHNAIILLFRCTTGEDWYKFMFDHISSTSCSKGTECGNSLAPLFFISFLLLSTFIMLNLFILIILEQFEEYHLRGANPFENIHENLEIFRKTWSVYSIKYSGLKIHDRKLIEFMRTLEPPLGFGKLETKERVAKSLLNMNLEADPEGCVYFNDLLFAVMKRAFGENFYKENAMLRNEVEMERTQLEKYIKIHEKRTKAKLERIKTRIYRKEAKLRKKVLDHLGKNTKINPFFYILYVRMAFSSWKRYTQELFRINCNYIIEEEAGTMTKRELFNEFSLVLSSESSLSDSESENEGDEGFGKNERDKSDEENQIPENGVAFGEIGERESENDLTESDKSLKMRFKEDKESVHGIEQKHEEDRLFDEKWKLKNMKRSSWAFPIIKRSKEDGDGKPELKAPRQRFASSSDLKFDGKLKSSKLQDVHPLNIEQTDDNCGDNTDRVFFKAGDSKSAEDRRETSFDNELHKLISKNNVMSRNGYQKVEAEDSVNKSSSKSKDDLGNNVSFL